MFTPASRDALRQRLVGRAQADPSCTAAALLGSAARDEEDAWSDIDLALRLADGADVDAVLADWTDWLTSELDVADTLDVHASGAVYRVFLCDDSLQIDLSLWPSDAFRATNGEPLRLLFGEVLESDPAPDPDWRQPARMGWLYALHARSAVARDRGLQADLMLTSWRQSVLTMACLRLGLNPSHGRGAHLLPDELQAALTEARPASLATTDLRRALARTAALYLGELSRHDDEYAARLRPSMNEVGA